MIFIVCLGGGCAAICSNDVGPSGGKGCLRSGPGLFEDFAAAGACVGLERRPVMRLFDFPLHQTPRVGRFRGGLYTGGRYMDMFWYVCDGEAGEYHGQEADWSTSYIVLTRSPEEALLKVMKYHLGKLGRRGAVYGGKAIEVIC